MFKLPAILLGATILASCQSFNSVPNRTIANSGALKGFIDDIARQTQNTSNRMTSNQIEKKVLEYIKRKEANAAYGNWSQMGILDDQAKAIDGLYDDLPYMNKVQKWVTQNITDILDINPNIAQKAYKTILDSSPGGYNPYKLTNSQLDSLTLAAQDASSPFARGIKKREIFVKKEIRGVSNTSQRRILQENYKALNARVGTSPTVANNMHEIVEGAANISKRTGLPGLGKGCKPFNANASEDVLESFANVQNIRSKLVEAKAFEKAGGPFTKIDDVAQSKRLTQAELDEIDVEAFQKALNYTREEASLAVKRLKRAPCQVL